jgi:flagellar hook-associated protein 3 FlgL
MAQTMIDFSTQSAVYQAALKAGATLIQPSLMDFLSS